MSGRSNNQGVPARIRDSGEVIQSPSYFQLLPVRTGKDVYDEDTITVVNATQTHTIQQSRRQGGHVAGWDYNDGSMSLALLRREGCWVADYYYEDNPDPSKLALNPTSYGAWASYWGRGDDNPPTKDHPILGAPVTHYRNGTNGKTGFVESCSIPLEFATAWDQSASGIFPLSPGGNVLGAMIYPRMRMFERLDINFAEIEGLHRLTGWSWFPETVVPSVAAATIESGIGLTMTDYFNAAWAYDPYTKTAYTFQGLFGTALDWTGNVNLTLTLTGTTLQTVGYAGWTTVGDQVLAGYWPTQGTSRKVIETGFIQESLDPLGAGTNCYTGVFVALTNQYGNQTVDQGFGTTMRFQRYHPGVPVVDRTYPNNGIGVVLSNTVGQRPAGWRSLQLFFVTAGTRQAVQDKMDLIFRHGWARRAPDMQMLPAHVIADAESTR